jgi:hypothetical protein
MRNYLKALFRKIIVKIQTNNEFNGFENEMSNIFEDVEDSLMLKYIVYTKNVNTLSDLLEINGLYHLTFSRCIIDKRIKLKYLESYKCEFFELKWSDQAKYFLRTLIALTNNFSNIEWFNEGSFKLVNESDLTASNFIECMKDCFIHQNVLLPTG